MNMIVALIPCIYAELNLAKFSCYSCYSFRKRRGIRMRSIILFNVQINLPFDQSLVCKNCLMAVCRITVNEH